MGGIIEVAIIVATEVAADVAAAAEFIGTAIGELATTIGEAVAEAATSVGEAFGIGGAGSGELGADAALTEASTADTLAASDLAPVADTASTTAASETGANIAAGPSIAQDAAPLANGTSLNEAGQVVNTATGAPVDASGAGSNLAQASNGVASDSPVAAPNVNGGTIIDSNTPVSTGDPALSQPQGIGSPGQVSGDPALNQPIGMSPSGGNPTATTSDPGFFEKGGFVDRNTGPTQLAGGLINGVGQGVSGSAQASSRVQAEKIAADNARTLQGNQQAYVAGNYSSAGGLLNGTSPSVPGNPTPTQRFDPRSYGGTYQFDPASGRIRFVANTGAQPSGAPTTTAPGAGAGA